MSHLKALMASMSLAVVQMAAGQSILVVDPAGGAGTHSTITAAVTAATHGDTVLVRTGTYGPPDDGLVIRKGIAILAEPGARITAPLWATLRVVGVPAGRRCVVDGLGFAMPEPGLEASGNQGEVVFANLVVSQVQHRTSTVSLTDCRQVVLQNVSAVGLLATRVTDLALLRCNVGAWCEAWGFTAIVADGGRVSLIDTTATGGCGYIAGGAGVLMRGGELTLAGASSVGAGTSLANAAASAVIATATAVEVDPTVVLTPQGGAPDITGASRVLRVPLPVCTLGPLARGTIASLTISAPATSPFCAVLAPVAATLPTTVGLLWFDPGLAAVVAVGAVGPTGRSVFPFAVPRDIWPGSTWVAQAGVLTAGNVRATSPGIGVAR